MKQNLHPKGVFNQTYSIHHKLKKVNHQSKKSTRKTDNRQKIQESTITEVI